MAEYKDSMKFLRQFACEPLDMGSLTPPKVMALRQAMRVVINTIDTKADSLNTVLSEMRETDASRKKKPNLYAKPKEEALRVRIVDFIRENGTVTEMQMYRKFRLNIPSIRKEIMNSYGIVSMTRHEETEDGSDCSYHFLANTGIEFKEGPNKGKPPKGHTIVGGGW